MIEDQHQPVKLLHQQLKALLAAHERRLGDRVSFGVRQGCLLLLINEILMQQQQPCQDFCPRGALFLCDLRECDVAVPSEDRTEMSCEKIRKSLFQFRRSAALLSVITG